MENEKAKIAEMVKNMPLKRRKPVPEETKTRLDALKQRLLQPIADLNKLHLKLWHAQKHNDYKHIDMDDLRSRLAAVRDEIDAIISESE